MELRIDLTTFELFSASNRVKAIKREIAKLIEEAVDKAGNKDRIAELLMDLDRNNKTNRTVYLVVREK